MHGCVRMRGLIFTGICGGGIARMNRGGAVLFTENSVKSLERRRLAPRRRRGESRGCVCGSDWVRKMIGGGWRVALRLRNPARGGSSRFHEQQKKTRDTCCRACTDSRLTEGGCDSDGKGKYAILRRTGGSDGLVKLGSVKFHPFRNLHH